jgi:hypothetical protein
LFKSPRFKSLTYCSGYNYDPDPAPGQDVWDYYCKTTGISATSTIINEYYNGQSVGSSVVTGTYVTGAVIVANSVQVRFQKSDLPGLSGSSNGGTITTSTSRSSGSGSSHSSNPFSSSSSSSGGTSTSSPSGEATGLSSGAKAGIGIGAAIGVIGLIAAVIAFFFLRRAKRDTHPEEPAYYENHGNHGQYQKPEMDSSEMQPESVYTSSVWAKRAVPTPPVPTMQKMPLAGPSEMEGVGRPTYASELSSSATIRSNANPRAVHGHSIIDYGRT